MRKILLVFIGFILLIGCIKSKEKIPLKEIIHKDSISINEYESLLSDYYMLDSINKDSIKILRNTIDTLKAKPIMSEEQFLKIYKYESLYKYYKIVMNNPSQKKFFWGWSKRVFEQ